MDIGNFRPLIKRDVKFETGDELDLRRKGVLATFKNGFGARNGSGRAIILDSVRAGYFGEAGVRDPHCVQYADGTPYIKDNKLYFTLTNAGLGFFEKAHLTVWTMDLSDYTNIEQVGNIFWYNEGQPNIILGHHAGQIIRDEEEGRWIVVASSWGDFGPQGGDQGNFNTITYPDEAPTYEPPVDILYNEVPLFGEPPQGCAHPGGQEAPGKRRPLPYRGQVDPGLTRINGRWHLSYVIALDLFSDFQPALARALSAPTIRR